MDSFGNQENNVFSDPPWGGCDKWDSAGSKSFWHRAAVDPNSAKWNIRCDGVTWCCKHLTQRGSCTEAFAFAVSRSKSQIPSWRLASAVHHR